MTSAGAGGAGAALYGPVVLEHFRRPRNHRTLDQPTASHEAFNPLCGDRVRIDVQMNGEILRNVAFTANACAICTASASLLTERVTGMAIGDALAIADDAVVAALESELPQARVACATLPLRALQSTLAKVVARA